MDLFFDETAQKLIINAKKEMYDLKHPYVGSEHLFLAILNDDSLDVTKILNEYGITYDLFRRELISVVGIGSKENNWFLFTPLLKKIINNAAYYSRDNDKSVDSFGLLISIFQEGDGIANRILTGMNIDLTALYDRFMLFEKIKISNKNKFLDEYAVNMNECALSGKYDPVIGREKQVNNLIQILLRKNKNNPLLIGDAGVGKTAIVEELARRISLGRVPFKLKNKIIYNLSMSVLVAGTKYRGEFEDKMNKLISEVKENDSIILFIDEIHTLIDAGGAEGAIDASNIIKPFLARGDLRLIGATTISEYYEYIEKDKALDRRFQKVMVSEPNKDEVKCILLKLKPIYEAYHGVLISEEIIDYITKWSFSCFFNGRQPDRAIDLLDEVCSYSSINHNPYDKILDDYENQINKKIKKKNDSIIHHNFDKALIYRNQELQLRSEYNNKLFEIYNAGNIEVSREDLEKVVCLKANFPKIENKEFQTINSKLKDIVMFQDDSIDKVFNYLKKINYIENSRPLIFLLVGKKGVGKTFFVSKLVECLYPTVNFIKINMSEYKGKQSITKLTGSLPGYVGYGDKTLFDSIRYNPFSVILFEKIDLAHELIIKMLKEAFHQGYIVTSKNEKIYLSKCIIFMTYTYSDNTMGFVESNKNKMIDFPISANTIFFNSFTIDNLIAYLNKKCGKDRYTKKEINKIIEEIDFNNSSFARIDEYISSLYDDFKVKS